MYPEFNPDTMIFDKIVYVLKRVDFLAHDTLADTLTLGVFTNLELLKVAFDYYIQDKRPLQVKDSRWKVDAFIMLEHDNEAYNARVWAEEFILNQLGVK